MTEEKIFWRRFGPKHEKPCLNPSTVTCAMSDCQFANECQFHIREMRRQKMPAQPVEEIVAEVEIERLTNDLLTIRDEYASYRIEKEAALEKQTQRADKLAKILSHLLVDKTGQFFICGEAGSKDATGLPEKILICPAYGLDGFAVYKKDSEYSAPEW